MFVSSNLLIRQLLFSIPGACLLISQPSGSQYCRKKISGAWARRLDFQWGLPARDKLSARNDVAQPRPHRWCDYHLRHHWPNYHSGSQSLSLSACLTWSTAGRSGLRAPSSNRWSQVHPDVMPTGARLITVTPKTHSHSVWASHSDMDESPAMSERFCFFLLLTAPLSASASALIWNKWSPSFYCTSSSRGAYYALTEPQELHKWLVHKRLVSLKALLAFQCSHIPAALLTTQED